MKKLFPLLAFILIVSFTSCSSIEENNDPIIGIWGMEDKPSKTAKNIKVRNEWIFNDAYLGRYHQYHNEEIVVLTDFRWVAEDDSYLIMYPGLEGNPEITVVMKDGQLIDQEGKIIANRE